MARLLVIALLLTACGSDSKPSPRARREICQRAAEKYTQCMKLSDADAANMRSLGKDGTCSADEAALLGACLEKQECSEYLACLLESAK